MQELIFPVSHDGQLSLQSQLRRQIVDAIMDGRLSTSGPLPSCRRLARLLGVSRNTVVLAYQALAEEGLLMPRERIGYFVNPDALGAAPLRDTPAGADVEAQRAGVDWWQQLRLRPSEFVAYSKPRDWHRYPYPFVYGHTDPKLFPVAAWRSCSRQAMSLDAIEGWMNDNVDEDDPLLIEEIRTKVLPRRGIKAKPDEILITLGAQNALYLLARLLSSETTSVGFEEPGYADARSVFELTGARIRSLPLDHDGLIVDRHLKGVDCVYVTPSHQSPTTVTLPLERRLALLDKARKERFMIVEDDYEAETNYISAPTTALKSLDQDGRVVYVGSFSKHLAPALRIGFVVAAPELVREARILRRFVLRQPPANNQRTVAHFIAEGSYDSLVVRLQRSLKERWDAMREALAEHLPDTSSTPSFGGTSYWVQGPEELDSDLLARTALTQGIVIEPGSVNFFRPRPPRNFLRLGFSSIETARIGPGIRLLADLIHKQF